jgi:DNA-binding transcriptional MocR family regulator
MLLTLDPADGRPRGQQLVLRIEDLIAKGHLAVGDRLPSTRRLAEQVGLHRATVATAYQTLWSLGWLELHPGTPPRVRARAPLAPAGPGPTGGFDWAARLQGRVLGQDWPPSPPPVAGQISFLPLSADPRLMPVEPFGRSIKAAIRHHGAQMLAYGEAQGAAGLRRILARRLGQHGIQTDADEILITHGAQQALELALRALTRPGDAVLVESPTYDQMLQLLAIHGLRAVALPALGDFDPDALERLLVRERPALLYTMPSFQNPTGRCLTQASRERMLALCQRHQVPILEDGFEEEMKYYGRPILPIKSMDTTGSVLYVGTFSKVLFPGLRIGWMAAPRPVILALTGLRHAGELCPPPLLQAALEDFLAMGRYDQHLARMHRQYRRRMDTALKTLARTVDPALARWEAPTGGFLIWLELLRPAPAEGWDAHFQRHGVRVALGPIYFPEPVAGSFIRLSISSLDPDQLERGLGRLARALAEP